MSSNAMSNLLDSVKEIFGQNTQVSKLELSGVSDQLEFVLNVNIKGDLIKTEINGRKDHCEHTRTSTRREGIVRRYKWDWLYDYTKYLEVGEMFELPFSLAQVHNPGCTSADLQKGMGNAFTRHFLRNGFETRDMFHFATHMNKVNNTVIIKRVR